MRVSVIVPIYEVEAYIEACLESLAAQDHGDLEIFLVDDCGKDRSIERAERFLDDPRFRLLRHEHNRGLSAARNTGIEAAGGELVCFVDSDDIVAPGFVSALVEARTRSGAPIISIAHQAFADGETPNLADRDSATAPLIVRGTGDADRFRPPFFAWLKAVDRQFLLEQDISFLEGEIYEDHRFHWLLAASDADMAWLDCPLYLYRVRGGSITADHVKAAVRVDILRELVDTIGQRRGQAVVDAGIDNILDAYVGLVAQVKDEELDAVFKRLDCDVRALGAAYPSYQPKRARHQLLWRLGAGSGMARSLLRLIVAITRRRRKSGGGA